MDNPRRSHSRPQNPLRHHSRRLPRNILDSNKHLLHVWLLPDVPLRPWRPLRIQRRSLRQPEYVGANRQRRPVYPSQEIPFERADIALFAQHALYPLRSDVLYDQFLGRAGRRDTQIAFGGSL